MSNKSILIMSLVLAVAALFTSIFLISKYYTDLFIVAIIINIVAVLINVICLILELRSQKNR